jgi:hypothetical protein
MTATTANPKAVAIRGQLQIANCWQTFHNGSKTTRLDPVGFDRAVSGRQDQVIAAFAHIGADAETCRHLLSLRIFRPSLV